MIKKRRIIVLPEAERDRRRILAITIGPIIEASLSDHSIAYRRGRSVSLALHIAAQNAADGHIFAFHGDISSYFDNIRHDVLVAKLAAILDRKLLGAIRALLASDNPRGIGITQGCPLSPMLSNLYLDALDRELNDRGIKTIRYSDNILCLCKTTVEAAGAKSLITEQLSTLGLSLNHKKSHISHINHITFLNRKIAGQGHDTSQVSRSYSKARPISTSRRTISRDKRTAIEKACARRNKSTEINRDAFDVDDFEWNRAVCARR